MKTETVAWFALGVSFLALLVSVLSAIGTWRQASAQRNEHAPTATSKTSNSGEYGNIELTFRAPLRITTAKIKVGKDSDLVSIGEPGTVEDASVTRIKMRDIVSGRPIKIPAKFHPGNKHSVESVLVVKTRGRGFGRVTTTVRSTSPQVWSA